MLIGYVRVSKSDGSQTLSPQRDAMLQAGVEPERIYQDLASGRHDGVARDSLQPRTLRVNAFWVTANS